MNDICEEELLALMKKISIRLEIQLEQNLREDDVSGVQVYLLVHILRRHRNGTYISELCREEGVSKTTMSLLIKKLHEKEYLVFQENEKDDRKKRILPTKKLLAAAPVFLERAERMEREICKTLSKEQRRQLKIIETEILNQCREMELQRKKQEVVEYENRFGTVETV